MVCFLFQIQSIKADSYCVISDDDNYIIEGKNMYDTQSVASISKVMTAIVAIENGNLKDSWKTGKELKDAYGSSVYLKEGQEVTLESMLYGLLLRSGNDCAVEIAIHIADDKKTFVNLMNKKAKEIGMFHTTFRNPSGLDEEDDGNISCAYDMAILMSYAMKNPIFREICGTKFYTTEWNYHWKNKNRLLFDYPYAIAGKTGFTKKARRTLITTATHNHLETTVVTLRTDDDFEFHKAKHTNTFNKYESVLLVKKGKYKVNNKYIEVPRNIYLTVKKNEKNNIKVYTHFNKDCLLVEVQHDQHQQTYSFDYKKRR